MNDSEKCPLCSGGGLPFFSNRKQQFFRCENCRGIFLSKNLLPDPATEFKRYQKHQNDVSDPGYRAFVTPLVSAVLNDFTPAHNGIDFGSGPESAVSKLLEDKGFQIRLYDPFFHDDKELLSSPYDYIVCCEVIEHFHNPYREFTLLKKLLRPEGKLYCMTHLFTGDTDFRNWYYKNDITHVFFYTPETINWVRKEFRFTYVQIKDRLIVCSL